MSDRSTNAEHPHVVVVGGGFGGLQAARGLRRAAVRVTLVDRRNFHLFQPLAYQVATGELSAVEITTPLRKILRRQKNAHVILAEVTGFDLERRVVLLDELANGYSGIELAYDTLVVAGGSAYSYFGHDEWAPYAPELKSLEGALDLRARLLTAFEAAEVETDEEKRRAWLTFVVVGAGPTGVEMAGQIAELARDTLRRDFRAVDTRTSRVLLVEAANRVLTSFPEKLSQRAERSLEKLGVTPMLQKTVVGVTADGVELAAGDGTRETIETRSVVWAAGVTASPLAGLLAGATGAETDRAGRVLVEPDLSLPGHPEVFAAGDMVDIRDAASLPGVAPVAIQQGRHIARLIRTGERRPFRYVDKGNLATIGRSHAVADIKGIQLSGFLAWLTWLGVHLVYLIGFQNRLLVLLRWMSSYVTRGRGARIIHGSATMPPPRND
jgi:NADH:ubiquinone reductase (H+-translocating)